MPDRSCPSNYIAARSKVTRDWFSVCCRFNKNCIYIFRFFKGLCKKNWSLPSLNMLTSNFMMIILTSILTVLSSKYGEKEACLNCSYGGSFINGRCECKEDSKSAGNSTHNFSTTINNFDKWKEILVYMKNTIERKRITLDVQHFSLWIIEWICIPRRLLCG